MKIDSDDLFHTVFDHLRSKEVLFALLLNSDLSVVFLHVGRIVTKGILFERGNFWLSVHIMIPSRI